MDLDGDEPGEAEIVAHGRRHVDDAASDVRAAIRDRAFGLAAIVGSNDDDASTEGQRAVRARVARRIEPPAVSHAVPTLVIPARYSLTDVRVNRGGRHASTAAAASRMASRRFMLSSTASFRSSGTGGIASAAPPSRTCMRMSPM